MLHNIQILVSLRIQMLFQKNILQRPFNQRQRSPDFMCHIGKEIYFSVIDLAFFFLLKLLELTAMQSAATLPEIPKGIYRTDNKQQYINAICPERKIKRRKNMNI